VPPFDCATCGACCREAFDSVPVLAEDTRMAERQPALVQRHADGWRDILRVPSPASSATLGCGTRCAALQGDGSAQAPFRCVVYEDRPTACSELEVGSESCRFARSRVGLSS
jgi:Fe-S-cluster containining protein